MPESESLSPLPLGLPDDTRARADEDRGTWREQTNVIRWILVRSAYCDASVLEAKITHSMEDLGLGLRLQGGPSPGGLA